MSPETLMRAYIRCAQHSTAWNVDTAFARAMGIDEYVRWTRIAKKLEVRILKYANSGHRLHKACLGLQRKEKERENAHNFYEGTDNVDYDPVIATFSLNAFRPFRFDIGTVSGDEYRERLSKHLKEL